MSIMSKINKLKGTAAMFKKCKTEEDSGAFLIIVSAFLRLICNLKNNIVLEVAIITQNTLDL